LNTDQKDLAVVGNAATCNSPEAVDGLIKAYEQLMIPFFKEIKS